MSPIYGIRFSCGKCAEHEGKSYNLCEHCHQSLVLSSTTKDTSAAKSADSEATEAAVNVVDHPAGHLSSFDAVKPPQIASNSTTPLVVAYLQPSSIQALYLQPAQVVAMGKQPSSSAQGAQGAQDAAGAKGAKGDKGGKASLAGDRDIMDADNDGNGNDVRAFAIKGGKHAGERGRLVDYPAAGKWPSDEPEAVFKVLLDGLVHKQVTASVLGRDLTRAYAYAPHVQGGSLESHSKHNDGRVSKEALRAFLVEHEGGGDSHAEGGGGLDKDLVGGLEATLDQQVDDLLNAYKGRHGDLRSDLHRKYDAAPTLSHGGSADAFAFAHYSGTSPAKVRPHRPNFKLKQTTNYGTSPTNNPQTATHNKLLPTVAPSEGASY
jgi:hypothetical protein